MVKIISHQLFEIDSVTQYANVTVDSVTQYANVTVN